MRVAAFTCGTIGSTAIVAIIRPNAASTANIISVVFLLSICKSGFFWINISTVAPDRDYKRKKEKLWVVILMGINVVKFAMCS